MTRRWARLSKEQTRELWRRWKQGQALSEISQALGGAGKTTVFYALKRNGGVTSRERRRTGRRQPRDEPASRRSGPSRACWLTMSGFPA